MENKTAWDTDKIGGLQEFASKIEKFIDVERTYTGDKGLVLSVSGKYGIGKSKFISMWCADIESRNNPEKPIMIVLDAWKNDYLSDPFFSIISNIMDYLEEHENHKKNVYQIKQAFKDISRFGLGVANQFVKQQTGLDVIEVGAYANSKKEKHYDIFEVYKKREAALSKLKKSLEEISKSKKSGMYIIIDELDRCRPDFAISYLETIKHMFAINNICFIIFCDIKQLENSAKTAFGKDLDFNEYYRKYVDRELNFPAYTEEKYKKLIHVYVKEYFYKDSSKATSIDLYVRVRMTNIEEIIIPHHLTIRQINEVFRILRHLTFSDADVQSKSSWCSSVASILLVVFKVIKHEFYEQMSKGTLNYIECHDYLNNILDYGADWWFRVLYTGNAFQIPEEENEEIIFKNIGYRDDQISDVLKLGEFSQGWSHMRLSVPRICENIENLMCFNTR